MKKRLLGILLVYVMVVIPLFSLQAAAADYTNGVEVSGTTAKIWFKSTVNTTWADVHYQVNSGAQQNVRMSYNSGAARYEQNVTVATGNVITYWFTYNNGTPAYDTPSFSYTVGSNPGTVATPSFNPAGGTYSSAQTVSISTATSGATIRYTTDGSTPTASSTAYAGPITVSTTKTIKTIAIKSGMTNSTVASASYTISTSGTPTLPKGNGVMTFQLQNGTRGTYPDSQIYWCVLGYNPTTHQLSYVDVNGNLIPASVADNNAANHLTKNGQNYANYFHTMSEKNWVSLPKIDSGRMFLSVGTPMYIKINTAGDGSTGFAGPDLGNPTDPNQDVYFDFVEFTIDNGGYHGNTTRVDQFGFPVTTRLLGSDGVDRTVGETETRAAIFSAYQNEVPAEFKTLVKAPYRIVAPGKGGFAPGGAYATYFDSYVTQVWDYYKTHELTFTSEAGTFSGHVVGNDFVFNKNGGAYNLYIHGKPTNIAVLEGSGNMASGSSDEKVVQAQLDAALNRHIVMDPANWGNSSTFYKAGPANYYAKFWHDHSIGGLAYGFCYDDVRSYSTLLEHPTPTGMIINVGW